MEVRRGGCRAHVALPAKARGRAVLVLHEAAAEAAWARILVRFDKHVA
jgi:hypothetical protein